MSVQYLIYTVYLTTVDWSADRESTGKCKIEIIAHNKEVNDVILCNVCMPEGVQSLRLEVGYGWFFSKE